MIAVHRQFPGPGVGPDSHIAAYFPLFTSSIQLPSFEGFRLKYIGFALSGRKCSRKDAKPAEINLKLFLASLRLCERPSVSLRIAGSKCHSPVQSDQAMTWENFSLMIFSASAMIRSSNSRQVGMSLISPMHWPADITPFSISPSSSISLPTSPET